LEQRGTAAAEALKICPYFDAILAEESRGGDVVVAESRKPGRRLPFGRNGLINTAILCGSNPQSPNFDKSVESTTSINMIVIVLPLVKDCW